MVEAFRAPPLWAFLIENMKTIFGIKGRMTQVFDDKGVISAATVITASPMTVSQVKTTDSDGYQALQFAIGSRKESRVSKAVKGHLKDIAPARYIREVRTEETMERGATVDLSAFQVGDLVEVSAISKGKGFQGVVKRHGFKGGPRSHGQKNKERAPGSIGGSGGRAGGRTAKDIRMAGRMGGDRVTVKNLRVLKVDADTNTLFISGAVPGRPGTFVEIHG
jgi:large subunit ribosomal protein L3